MKRTIMSALFCGAILTTYPAFAAGIGVGGTAGGGIGAGPVTGAAGTSVGTGVNTSGQVTRPAGGVNNYSAADINAALGVPDTTTAMNSNGASRSTGGLSTSGEINNATAGNNAGSVDTTIQTPSSRMRQQAQANANAATQEQTTRQLIQQPQTNVNPAIGPNGAIH